MAPYATVADFRATMEGITPGAEADARILAQLVRATGLINLALEFKFEGYALVATPRHFSGGGGNLLRVPYHEAGSVVSVGLLAADLVTETAITDYETEWDDHTRLYRAAGWVKGRYSVVAKWGYGEPTDEIANLCLQKAINLWIGSQGGQFSDVVGIEGGAVGYNRAWTNEQKFVLDETKRKYAGWGVA